MTILLDKLLPTLQRQAELFGLEQAETEELIAWASLEMANPSQSSAQPQQMSERGCRVLSLITSSKEMQGAFAIAMLTLSNNCRSAFYIETRGKVPQVVAYLNNRHNRS